MINLTVLVIAVLIGVSWSIFVRFVWKAVPDPKPKFRDPKVWMRYGGSGRSLAAVQKKFAAMDYPIFSTEYDVEIDASDLWTEMGTSRPQFSGTWRDAYSNRSSRYLGFLDETTESLRKVRRSETLLTLLIDHSGSMRGEPSSETASAVGIVGEILDAAGYAFEVLGFTTRSWHGGEARKTWVVSGRPPMPGRLCELLHIVYKASTQSFEDVKADLQLLNCAELLRENIDGEAILWAQSRFEASGAKRWVCLVISDGAPVDDSTISSNSKNDSCDLLVSHHRKVISGVMSRPDCIIAGLAIMHGVPNYYPLSEQAPTADVILEKLASVTLQAVTASFNK